MEEGKWEMIRVLLVDDQRSVRQGLQLRLGLEPDLAVVGETGSAEEALALAQALLPDVIVVDVQMRGTDGMDSLKRLQEVAPAAAMIVLTLQGDGDTRTRAQTAGAHAFVEKQGGAEGLLETIRGLGSRSPGT